MKNVMAVIFCIITSFSIGRADDGKIGYSIFLSGSSSATAYTQLTNYLSKMIGINFTEEFQFPYLAAVKSIGRREVNAGLVCSGPYARWRKEYGLEPVASVKPKFGRRYQSYIIVPASATEVKSLREIKGRSIAFVDMDSYTGRIALLAEIRKAGDNPLKYFSSTKFVKTHDAAIEAVANGQADSAVAMSLVYEARKTRNPEIIAKTKVIAMTPSAGTPLFVVGRGTKPEFKKKLTDVLMKMKDDPEGRKILDQLDVEAFVKPVEKDYQIIDRHIASTRDLLP